MEVLLCCFLLCTMIYSSMGAVGYRMFGANTLSEITLNLPTKKTSSRVAIFTTLVNLIVKYALLMKPIVDTIEEGFPSVKPRRVSVFIRTALVGSTVVIALAFPFFEYWMSIVGALLIVSASIILPSMFYVRILGSYKMFGVELLMIGCVVFIGILIAAVGTYTSIADMARKL
ncbi:putative amino acid transporter, transmembrane domain-containing protein [Helianthus debilis subsp. tardiflorus]